MDNGQPKTLDIIIRFDPESQVTLLEFDTSEYRTWDFVLGILTCALERAKQQRTIAMANEMHARQAQAMEVRQMGRILQAR